MLSISKIESLSHGLDYYTKDNYYAKEDQKDFTQWYGKAAEMLGLKGDIKLDEFKKALSGLNEKGKFGVKEISKKNDDIVSYEKLFFFKKDSSEYLKSLPISEESKEQVQKIFDKISTKNDKINKTSLEKFQNNISSILNKETSLNFEERIKVKTEIRDMMEIFKKSASRRPGYDLTFSAPKSVSIAALVGGDTALIQAHRESVKEALRIVEKEYSQTRVRETGKSERNIEVTGNIAAAMFEHDVSRKTDPQLHTHSVIMNFTKKDDGSWRSINQDGFFYDSKKIGLIYQNELAKRVKNLGYEINKNSNGTFDIKGYSKDQLDQFSKRTVQMAEMGATTQKEKSKIIKKNRDKKDESIPRDQLQKQWKKEAESVGIEHPKRKENIKKNVITIVDPVLIKSVIEDSIKDITANDVSFKKSKLESVVLEKILGKLDFNYEDIKLKIDEYLSDNSKQVGTKNVLEYVPNYIVDLELDTIAIMQRGKDTFDSILSKEKARKITDEIDEKSKNDGHMGLNDGQRDAIEVMLTSNDRIFCWQGVAGAGKSFSLGAASKIAMENNFVVKGFAPSAEAAKNLAAEAKLNEAHTVASLLVTETEVGKAKGNEIWIVDEAGLLSAGDAHALLKKAEIENARLLLVGDTRQLSSVGAGNPFKQLQEHGIKTAQLTEGIRQKDKTMKKSVDLIAEGKHRDGLEVLDRSGKVYEVKDKEVIIANMANDYLKLEKEDVKKTLFISSTNYEKEQITNIVRAELKGRGDLTGSINAVSYVAFDYNEHALKYSHVYNVDNFVILNKRSHGLIANKPYKVLDINHSKNTIIVQTDNGKKEINVSKIKCNLFKEEKIELSVGDRIKWTKNHAVKSDKSDENKPERRLNGQYMTVKEIDLNNKKAVFEYESGKFEKVDLSQKQFIDYSYVTTVFSSQGKTCDKVYASLTNVDRENFYVAISRAKYDCKLYSNDRDNLYKKVDKFGANITAMEKLSQMAKDISSLKSNSDVLNPDINVSKILANEIALTSLNRKIKESTLEVIYKLSLDPDKAELKNIHKYGFNNQEIVSKMFYYKINGQFGITTKEKAAAGRKPLSTEELIQAKKIVPQLTPAIIDEIKNKILELKNTSGLNQATKLTSSASMQTLENGQMNAQTPVLKQNSAIVSQSQRLEASEKDPSNKISVKRKLRR